MVENPFHRLSHSHQAVLTAGAGLFAAYSAYRYEGPYRWIAGLQIQLFGVYELFWTIFFTFLFFYIVFGLLFAFAIGPKSDSGLSVPDYQTKFDLSRFVDLLYTRRGQLAMLSLGFLVVSGYQYFVARSLGERKVVSLASIESGAAFPSDRWWEVEGRPLFEEQSVWRRNHTEYFYIPLVSKNWKSGQSVKIVLLAMRSDIPVIARQKTALYGLSDPFGVPGDVAHSWNSGEAPLADDTALLIYGDGPEKRLKNAQISILISLVTGVISAVIFLRLRTERDL